MVEEQFVLCASSPPYGLRCPAGSRALYKWQYMFSMLGPNTCSDSSLCQLHISIYKFSPSALRYHVGVVSSVCFYFAILLHWVLLNTGESALIRDQPSLKHSFITVESREELCNYVHPHQGWLFAFSLPLLFVKDQVCFDANKNDASVQQFVSVTLVLRHNNLKDKCECCHSQCFSHSRNSW